MARIKKSTVRTPLKQILLEEYFPLPIWLIQAMGLQTAVFLAAIIDIYNGLVMGEKISEGKLNLYGKMFVEQYGLSYHIQKAALLDLHHARMIKWTGRNRYQNKTIQVMETWCWVIFDLIRAIEPDHRSLFFEKLKTSKKLRSIIRTNISTYKWCIDPLTSTRRDDEESHPLDYDYDGMEDFQDKLDKEVGEYLQGCI